MIAAVDAVTDHSRRHSLHFGWSGRAEGALVGGVRQISGLLQAFPPCVPVSPLRRIFRMQGPPAPEIPGVHDQQRTTLLQSAGAGRGTRFFPGLVQGRQQHRRQDGDDRNNDQKLDKGK